MTADTSPRRVRHKVRGSTYEVLGIAELQISGSIQLSMGMMQSGARVVREGDKLTVYRCEDDGRLWTRFPDEFEDGRFEEIGTSASGNLGFFDGPSLGTQLNKAALRIRDLEKQLAEKQAAIDAAYAAMSRALRLGQINVKDISQEPRERQELRLQVFRALDMPLACLGGHVTPEVRDTRASPENDK